jgi:tetratricopeptide (TPR) repeat protein
LGKSNTALMGKSLTEISEATGISVSYLSLILNGKRKNVSLAVLTRIGEALGISIEETRLLISQQIKSTLPKKAKTIRSSIEQEEIIEKTLAVLEKNLDNQELNQLKSRAQKRSLSDFPLKESYLLWIDGFLAWKNNQYQEALNLMAQGCNFKAITSNEKRMLARIYGGLGGIYIGLSDYKMSLKMLKKSLNIWSKGNEAAVAYLNLGTLYRRKRKYSSAIRAYTFSRNLGQSYVKTQAYSGLGQIYMDLNNMPLARSVLLEGYVFCKKNTEKWGCQDLFCNLGEYYKSIGRLQRAEFILKKGLKYAQKFNAARAKDFIRLEIAEVHLLQNRGEKAVHIFNEMSAEVSQSGDLLLLGSTLLRCAKKYLSTFYYEEALQYLNKSYMALSGIGPTSEILESCKLLLEYHLRKHNSAEVQFYKDEIRKIKNKLK